MTLNRQVAKAIGDRRTSGKYAPKRVTVRRGSTTYQSTVWTRRDKDHPQSRPSTRVRLHTGDSDAADWEGDLDAFLADNEELDANDIRDTLTRGETVPLGGGAGPEMRLVPVKVRGG